MPEEPKTETQANIQALYEEAVRRQMTGPLAEAEHLYRKALDIDPRHAASLHGLGSLALQGQRYDVAVDLIAQAIAVDGAVGGYHFNLGLAYQNQGRHDAAIAAYRRSLILKPKLADAHINLGLLFMRLGMPDDAIAHLGQAVALRPDAAAIHHHLGNVLKSRGRRREAVIHYRKTAALTPGYDIFYDLATTLDALSEAGEALIASDQAIRARPDFHAPYAIKGASLFKLGRWEEAVDACRKALDLKPHSARGYSNLLSLLTSSQVRPQEEVLALARGFEAATCRPADRPFKGWRPGTRTKLRIGFLSAEVGMHPVASFLETYLRHYDRTQVEVWLYSTMTWGDARRDILLALVDHAVDLDDAGGDAARDRIIADQLDILIETTGHTSHGKMPMLSQRCAPIQCSHMGYFGTTGVRAIDYVIGDNEISPPSFSAQFSERLIQLPDIWMTYTPPGPLPNPESLSADDEIVLGSFNNFAKIREGALDLWSRLLLEIPSSRLVLKDRLSVDPLSRQRILGHIAAQGIDSGRIEFLHRTDYWEEHMKCYNQLDIALDTFPFNSCTTGFEAVCMGTPVVAMRGGAWPGRMSASIVKTLGRPEWVAEDADTYVAVVRALASDKPVLRQYKRTLRAEMLRSPVGNGPRFARALEAAFRTMIASYNAGEYPIVL
jgi:protein O-GlcNAc transferase